MTHTITSDRVTRTLKFTNITSLTTPAHTHHTPSAGIDYNWTNQLLTFDDTITSVPVTVGIINNGFYEDDITFGAALTLQSAAGYKQSVTLDPLWANTTIVDDINGKYMCVCVHFCACMCVHV